MLIKILGGILLTVGVLLAAKMLFGILAAVASDFDGYPQLPTVAESKREERMSQPPPSGKWFDEKVEPLELREIVAALEMGHCEIGRRTVPAITNTRYIHAVSVKSCRRQHGLVS